MKCWFDAFFAIPPAAYIGFTFSIFTQIFRNLFALYRLSTIDIAGWDHKGVLKGMNPLLILDQIIKNCEKVPNIAGLDRNENAGQDVFSRGAQLFRSLAAAWETKPDDPPPFSDTPVSQYANENTPFDSFAVDYFDNDWLMDIFSSASYSY